MKPACSDVTQGYEHYEKKKREHEQQGLPPPPMPTRGASQLVSMQSALTHATVPGGGACLGLGSDPDKVGLTSTKAS